jgi:PAS domain S-box-containing protein
MTVPESGPPARGLPLDVADLGRLFELSLDLLAIASPVDGYFMRVNPAVSRILGWSERELLEIPIATLGHPEDLPESIRGLAKLVRGESLLQFEHRLRCKDGRYRWIGWNTASSPAAGLVY